MPRKIVITESAKDDLISGHAFFEMQARGAGDYFLEWILRDIDRLTQDPENHPKPPWHSISGVRYGNQGKKGPLTSKHRRMICSRHPYGVFYNCTDTVVQVVAVIELSRLPHRVHDLFRKR